MDALVHPSWLEAHLGDGDLRVLDTTVDVKLKPFPRIRSGRHLWKRGHVPGAGFADLRKLGRPGTPRRTFTLPEPQWFATQVALLGVGQDTRVVLYDSRQSMWAARLWWTLRAFGFEDAAILDGGWTAWQLEGRPVCAIPCGSAAARPFIPTPHPAPFVGKEEVLAAIDDPNTTIVCALGHRQYTGEHREYGRRRGHIPGSVNVSAWRILDRDTQRYLPEHELRRRFGAVVESQRVITYCGGGVAASSVAFALHLLGHRNVAVYDGGFIEWSADRRLPLTTGAAP